MPFFAAQNVADEPAPGQPGTTQTYTISGLNPAKTYNFAVRALADPPASTSMIVPFLSVPSGARP